MLNENPSRCASTTHKGPGFRHDDVWRVTHILGCVVLIQSLVGGCATPKKGVYAEMNWGYASYEATARQLRETAVKEMEKPIDRRSRDAGVTILDYASACLAAGEVEAAQKALYEGILLTNDLTLGQAAGYASLFFDEAVKTWQGEAYERAMIELLHAAVLMQAGDFDNARVACDRALMTDRFSKGALVGVEGECPKEGRFEYDERCSNRGYSVLQRDFLAAYILRTICYIQQGRSKRAAASWDEAKDFFEELCSAWRESLERPPQEVRTWTGPDGRYTYPNAMIPPFRSEARARGHLFSKSLEELAQANLVIITATGSRPQKTKVGTVGGISRTVNYVHDGYRPPSEAVIAADVFIDGAYRGAAVQGLNLFGQAAGRGPSLKDLAQERKETTEKIGEALHQHGSYGAQYVGMLIEILNREEADVRQWELLPNAIHIWVGRVEPGTHRLSCMFTGSNMPTRDLLVGQQLASGLGALEKAYVVAYEQTARASEASWGPVASRHTRVKDVMVPETGLATVFIAEQFNAHVSTVDLGSPRRYELLPRRFPPKS